MSSSTPAASADPLAISLPPLAKLKVRAARDPEAYVDLTAS
jgi:hypothetical protein